MDRPGKPGFGWLFKFCLQTSKETGTVLKINEKPSPNPALCHGERVFGETPGLLSVGAHLHRRGCTHQSHTGAAPEPHRSRSGSTLKAILELHAAPQGLIVALPVWQQQVVPTTSLALHLGGRARIWSERAGGGAGQGTSPWCPEAGGDRQVWLRRRL